jgi:serine/threonine protein phosphatase PrpC
MTMSRSASPPSADDRWPIDAGWATATGPRPDNQDRVATSARWAVVSDGAGGHRGGEVAAQLTVDAVASRLGTPGEPFDEGTVGRSLTDANAAVRARRAADPDVSAMVATLTLAVARRVDAIASTWLLLDVGDSPAWLLRAGRLHRLTREDNMAAELVRVGAISRAEARHHPGRHVITKAIGSADTVVASHATMSLRPGDALVLASDGVEVLDEATMADVMSGAAASADAARAVVAAALAHGASDNVTVAVVRHRAEALEGLADPAAGDGPR